MASKLSTWQWPKDVKEKLLRPTKHSQVTVRSGFSTADPRYGSIRFAHSSSKRPAKWVCIGKPHTRDLRNSVEAILQLMIEPNELDSARNPYRSLWHLSQPHLLISVVGAANRELDEEQLPRDVKDVFLRGLRAAATKTRAWILTVGTNVGVPALVGEVLREHSMDEENLVLVGIGTRLHHGSCDSDCFAASCLHTNSVLTAPHACQIRPAQPPPFLTLAAAFLILCTLSWIVRLANVWQCPSSGFHNGRC